MTGQLIFYSCLLYVLIDYSATYCIVAKGIVERLGLEPTTISLISIEMLDEDKVLNSHMLIKKIVSLRG